MLERTFTLSSTIGCTAAGEAATNESIGNLGPNDSNRIVEEFHVFLPLPMCETVCYLTARWMAIRPPRTPVASQALNPWASAMRQTAAAPG